MCHLTDYEKLKGVFENLGIRFIKSKEQRESCGDVILGEIKEDEDDPDFSGVMGCALYLAFDKHQKLVSVIDMWG